MGNWLKSLGLERYAQRFVQEELDFHALSLLSDDDLKELGLSLGARRTLQAAIAQRSEEATQSRQAPGPPATARDAERRQLTVLFCDLVGSTELAHQLDPEDLREVYRAYQDACKRAIESLDGYVAQYLGDGVLAYFGYPQAHEDDPERAIRAGLRLVAAVDELNDRSGRATPVELAVRVGIATGPVVVGDLIGEGVSQERAVVGETPNLAARLQGLAPRNKVVIASSTKLLAAGVFAYRDHGEQDLKGLAERVRVWEVVGESGVNSRFEAIRGGALLTPLVGRDGELDLLLSRWRRTTAGEGQLVLLSGEPGIGKSRLLEAVLARLAAEPHVRLRYDASPHHTDRALYPVIRQLEDAAGLLRDDTPRVKLNKLAALQEGGSKRAAETVPLLAALLAVPTDDRYSLPMLTPQAQKARTFAALIEQIEGYAAHRPGLVVLEDAHWLDPSTAELFGLLISRLHELRILLLVTYRPGFVPPWSGFAAAVTSVTLNRLGPGDGAQMVHRIAGGKPLPADVLEHILRKTDGVPLFVEEITKTVLESGALRDAGDCYELLAPLPTLVVPATLHDSLMFRLDRQTSAKEVARVGAVIGREFSFELLAAVTSLPHDVLAPALTHLVESELVFRRGDPPEAVYTFKHALVQDAAYQSLLNRSKRELHARIAEVLEARFPDTVAAEPERLAEHLSAANLAERAIPYWLTAGRRALSGSNLPEAVSTLSRALTATATIGEASARADRELEVRTALGGAMMALRGWPALEVRDVVKPACDLVEAGHGKAEDFMNLWHLWVHHGCRAEHREGLAVVDRMLAHARRQPERVLVLVSSFTAAMAHLWLGNYDLAHQHERTALELYDDQRDAPLVWSYNHDPKNTLLSWGAFRVWAMGYPDQARALSDEAVAHARKVGHPFNLCWTLGNSSITYGHCGDYNTVEARIEELRRISHDQELHFMAAYMARSVLSVAAAQVGRDTVAEDEGDHAERVWRGIGGRFWSPVVRAGMAQAAMRLGRAVQATALIGEALSQMEATDEFMVAEEIYRIAGLVRLECGDEAGAKQLFDLSLEHARRHGTKSFELRTAMSLARLFLDEGRRRDAHDLLQPIYEWFTEGSDTADLRDARALLLELT